MAQNAPHRSSNVVSLRDHMAAPREVRTPRPADAPSQPLPTPSQPTDSCNPVELRDRACLQSVAREIGAALVSVTKEWVGEFGFERHLVSYESEGAVTPAARRLVESLTKPAVRREVVGNFQAVALAMPRRPGDDVAPEAWLDLAWTTVSDFPEDVILQGLDSAVKQEGRRPSPAVIRGECRRLNERRAALRKWAFGQGAAGACQASPRKLH